MRRTALRTTAAAISTAALVALSAATLAPATAAGQPAATPFGPKPVDVQLLAINDFHGNLEAPGGSGGRIQVGVDAAGGAVNVNAGGAEYLATRVQGVQIGFIGMTLEGTAEIVSQEGVAGLDFADEVEIANRYADELQAQGVETIVVLLHEGGRQTGADAWDVNGCSGLQGPIVDIANGMDDAIDVVVSGHTHQAYNCEIDGKLVTSASSFGRLVTQIDLSIDRRTGDVLSAGAENVIVTRDRALDPEQTELIARYREALGPIANQVVGFAQEDLTTAQEQLFQSGVSSSGDPVYALGESALGNVIADAQLAATGDEAGAVAAFMNPGGVRADLLAGEVTYEEAFTVQPFTNNLVTVDLTGAQLYCMLEQQFQVGRTLYPSATVSYTVDAAGTTAATGADPCTGSRVVDGSLELSGATVLDTTTYRVTVNNFLSGGGDGFSVLTGATNLVTGPTDLDAFTDYLGDQSPVSAPSLDRIVTTAELAAVA